MHGSYRLVVAAGAAILGLAVGSALAQKPGGTLRVSNSANPTSMSIHEEVSITTVQAAMPLFNNLVMFDPAIARNSPESIIPELAESWGWDAAGTKLTFKLRAGVKWHDGKPMTAKDVQCTWHRVNGKEPDYYRKNPRRIWYTNLKEVTVNGDHEATFHLERPQPALLSMLASGMAPVFPCHVAAKDMRTNPIGTGPFKFVEFKSNELVRLVRNPDYWKPGRPYLDAVESRIIPNRSTRSLALVAGEIDMTSTGDVNAPLMKDFAAQAPHVYCKLGPTNVSSNVLINKARAPFDNPQLRRALMLGLDRQGFIDIMSHGQSSISGVMQAAPEGVWGMPKDVLETLPGYSGTLEQRQAEARKIMESLGYGPQNRIKIKVSTRDFSTYKEPAVILVDQLNKLYFEAELEIIESTIWFGRAARQDFTVAFNLSGVAIDDPDVTITENFACKSDNNFTKYCNPEVDKLLEEQSGERDPAKRKALVWQIERVLAEEVARPIISHGRAAQCWQPYVKGFVRQENSIYNHWRLEQVWLDR
ncbi:MAG: ABC transporter substrate-binding protein [Hyphomicrobiaceae bacterium]